MHFVRMSEPMLSAALLGTCGNGPFDQCIKPVQFSLESLSFGVGKLWGV
jgi:hypothetical protein